MHEREHGCSFVVPTLCGQFSEKGTKECLKVLTVKQFGSVVQLGLMFQDSVCSLLLWRVVVRECTSVLVIAQAECRVCEN